MNDGHISIDEYRSIKKKKNKLHSTRTNGYASKKEANYAGLLELCEKSGNILGYAEQVSIPLAHGHRSRYRLDFMVIHQQLENGHYEVSFVDPTGMKTAKKSLNIKAMHDSYGIEVETP